jgi:hypothetical protein
MRVFRAQGNREKATFYEAAYRKYKDDETSRALAADLRRDDPWVNRESLPIHVHAEAQPPPAEPAAWVTTIGPKGYETDFGYIKRAHPPLMREATDYRAAAPATPGPRPAGPS